MSKAKLDFVTIVWIPITGFKVHVKNMHEIHEVLYMDRWPI